MAESGPFYEFLPLALAAVATALLLGPHWLAALFSDRDKSLGQHQTNSQGAPQ
jgi:hypothetical protein